MDAETLNPVPLEGDTYSSYPLTCFDQLFESTTFLTGWLVEGSIDASRLSRALTNVTSKWRALAGRLYSVEDYDGKNEWRIRVPLAAILPSDYELFKITTSRGEHPLSHYVQTPLPVLTRSLPHSLFIDDKTPRQYTDWEATGHPLTCWHITHLPADPASGGNAHTCIGFARSHGIFDGVGAALVVRAVIAELHGQEWEVPPLPASGFHPNPVEDVLQANKRHRAETEAVEDPEVKEYHGYTALGPASMVKQLAWHAKEKWWSGADRRIVLLEQDLLTYLVNSVREEFLKNLAFDGEKVEVSTGDILLAWIIKSIYSHGTSLNTTVQCSNLASFRHLLEYPDTAEAMEDHDFDSYIHNLFTPLPYPAMSVHTIINGYTVSSLANMLATARRKLSIEHVLKSHKVLQGSYPFPVNTNADETLLVSNVSASKILEADWTPAITQGSGKILCGYRYQLTPNDVLLTNMVYISGRLSDGSVVLDVSISRERADLLVEAIAKLKAQGLELATEATEAA